METAELKMKYTTIRVVKDFDKTNKDYHGFISIDFDHLNEQHPNGKFFALTTETELYDMARRFFHQNAADVRMEDWSILITPKHECDFGLTPSIVFNVKEIETRFDKRLTGEEDL